LWPSLRSVAMTDTVSLPSGVPAVAVPTVLVMFMADPTVPAITAGRSRRGYGLGYLSVALAVGVIHREHLDPQPMIVTKHREGRTGIAYARCNAGTLLFE
jgi:hypothetical protein